MLKAIGLVIALVGLLSAVGGVVWNLLFPTLDANIGAGALVVIGLPVAGVGVLLFLFSLVIGRRSPQREAR